MRAYFKYAFQEEYVIRNPMDKIRFLKEPITLINTFTNDEVVRKVRFYKGSRYLDVRNQLIMILLLDTGMRNAELCGLKLTDIRDTYINILGKGKKIRHVATDTDYK
ncbi:tyrosine-type recombinase/integrase [Anaerosporobacter faecicola]|uniref:tyrosine-type recombinase/integrase n=1 Tax=Anaerosporobacter faecicola TaxID=2718714 RepID=UPI001EE5219E|nr:tyrosine-type recombinase/integrase [Anaerosporobacter faecicola]